MSPKLALASTSPRRHAILESIGVEFEIVRVDTDESPLPDEVPQRMVQRLAAGKAAAATSAEFALGADTVVVIDGRALGKPRDADDALDMLLTLSGRTHEVMTGVAMKMPNTTNVVLSSTKVEFREIDRDEALRYWHSGEPADKAGSYGIQGLGGAFVKSIHGSYSGVMGLPVFETVQLLRSAGFHILASAK